MFTPGARSREFLCSKRHYLSKYQWLLQQWFKFRHTLAEAQARANLFLTFDPSLALRANVYL
jgi:hypothetical protein